MTSPGQGGVRPIEEGETAPDFTLPAVNSNGAEVNVTLSTEGTKGRVLLVFYEDDGMPVCTNELRAFAQEHELLRDAGVRVFGINTNGLGSHARFQERDRFPFPLISDFYGDTVRAFGLWNEDEGKSRRALVVVGPGRRVLHVQPHFNPGNLPGFAEVFAALGLM